MKIENQYIYDFGPDNKPVAYCDENEVVQFATEDCFGGQIKTEKDFSLTDEALCEFEEYLNSNLPKFEEDMYDSISVEHSKG